MDEDSIAINDKISSAFFLEFQMGVGGGRYGAYHSTDFLFKFFF